MAAQHKEIPERLIEFIRQQRIYFVATATETSRINLSPKGMDSLRVLTGQRVVWLNVTGSGNESSAHVQVNPRMTLMFCAFDGPPLILRLYGSARVIHKTDPEWQELYGHFNPLPGARQIFDLSVEMVQTSCGMAVPNYEYNSERELLNDWATKRGEEGLEQYWREKNQASIDNLLTHIVERNILLRP